MIWLPFFFFGVLCYKFIRLMLCPIKLCLVPIIKLWYGSMSMMRFDWSQMPPFLVNPKNSIRKAVMENCIYFLSFPDWITTVLWTFGYFPHTLLLLLKAIPFILPVEGLVGVFDWPAYWRPLMSFSISCFCPFSCGDLSLILVFNIIFLF